MLEDLAKMHNIWIAMALNMGVPYEELGSVKQDSFSFVSQN